MVIKELFGYHCDCNLCIADRKVGKTARATREELEQAAEKLVFASKPGQNIGAMLSILSKIDKTYPSSVYPEDMARIAGRLLLSRICQSYHVLEDQKALARHAMSLLKRCGFKIEGHDSTGGPRLIQGVNSAMSPMVVVALIYLGRVQESESQADAHEKLAKEAYIIINVEEGGFEKLSSPIPACGNIRKEKPPTLETINPRLQERLQSFYDNI